MIQQTEPDYSQDQLEGPGELQNINDLGYIRKSSESKYKSSQVLFLPDDEMVQQPTAIKADNHLRSNSIQFNTIEQSVNFTAGPESMSSSLHMWKVAK